MDSSNIQLRLSELRRELKEILSMIETTSRSAAHNPHQRPEISLSNLTEVTSSQDCDVHTSARDRLFDEALIVLTEFGQATPSILQMWLSIDYGCASGILREFETQGLVSSSGKVRHKAYLLRRSKGTEFKL